MTTIGLLHPGEMGAAIGARLVVAGHRVLWASAGRSAETRRRAEAAGLTDVGSVRAVGAASTAILSVCPPAAAAETASSVAGFSGMFVDANAIAPDTSRQIGRQIEAAGGQYVDGGLIGKPPEGPGDVRLYLSGGNAAAAAGLFVGTCVEAIAIDDRIGSASALKAAYAGWTKGIIALLLTMRDYARCEGVEQDLLTEWRRSQPGLPGRHEASERAAGTKGWRWVAEMNEIGSALASVGLPDGFHRAAAAVYAHRERLPSAP